METVEINGLNEPVTPVALESLPDAIQGMIDGPASCDDCEGTFPASHLHNGICADCCFKRPNYWEAYCSGVASEITDGVCPKCGAEDLPW